MLKRKLCCALLSLSLCFTAGLTFFRLSEARKNKQEVENKLKIIADARRSGAANTKVHLREATEFEWDRVYIFTPYTPVTTIDRALGFKWHQARRTGIQYHDHFNLMVFTKAGDVVGYVEVTTGDFDVPESRMLTGFSSDEAVFEVTPEGFTFDAKRDVISCG